MEISHNWNEWCGNLVRMITVILEAEGHLSDHISIVSLKIIEGESPSINSVYVDKTRLKYTTHGELLMYAFRQMTNASRLRRRLHQEQHI